MRMSLPNETNHPFPVASLVEPLASPTLPSVISEVLGHKVIHWGPGAYGSSKDLKHPSTSEAEGAQCGTLNGIRNAPHQFLSLYWLPRRKKQEIDRAHCNAFAFVIQCLEGET